MKILGIETSYDPAKSRQVGTAGQVKPRQLILGIETSCDETAAAVVKVGSEIEILSNVVASQIKLHRQYGVVFPELASRTHLENILPTINLALKKARTNFAELEAIAVTVGPGLIGSLLMGVETARTLAYSFKKPLIGINHLEGHLAANFVDKNLKQIEFPIICLIVSGGHTSLVLMRKLGNYKTIGQTRDDAAGEAFDKVAQLLGLEYPGGPAIEVAALKSRKLELKIKLPRPMIDSEDFDFSFSGLKTAVLRLTKELGPKKIQQFRNEIAAEFQQAIVDVLVAKTLKAAQKYQAKTILLSGGVAANSALRKKLEAETLNSKANFLMPPKNLCTDNAAMIAVAAALKINTKSAAQEFNKGWQKISAQSNLELS